AVAFVASCKKEKEETVNAQVETLDATDINVTTATAWGRITEQGTAGIMEYGIEHAGQMIPHTVTGDGSFGVRLDNLRGGRSYTYRAYAVENSGTTRYGAEKTFSTLTPVDSWVSFSDVTDNSATVNFSNTDQLSDWGFYWKEGSAATTSDTKVEAGGRQAVTLDGLKPYTRYYILAYATGKNGLEASSTNSFTTGYALPQLTKPAVSGITTSAATVTFEIASIGGSSIDWCGIQYSTDRQNWTKQWVNTTNPIAHNLTGLKPATTYYVQAWARNTDISTDAYSETAEFTTQGSVPALAKPAVAPQTSYRVNMTGGSVTNAGQLDITEYGFCWSATPGAAAEGGNFVKITGSMDNFTYLSYDLMAGTRYYVRAYAKNAAGTGYSEEVAVTTPDVEYDEVDDWYIVGKKYKTVEIGDQTWMAEDLVGTDGVTTKFGLTTIINNGTSMCPTGWHIPGVEEWDELIAEAGGSGNAYYGGNNAAPKVLRIKEEGYEQGLNSSGMSVAARWKDTESTIANYWTSTQVISTNENFGRRIVQFYNNGTYTSSSEDYVSTSSMTFTNDSWTIYPVRCIKD
ncbi:MAG: fibronectin type III domain-containing protein, partial [Bacteroidales bacterium]|nr:fibronectin type III domain-containing protein [Bacteroidales bacterium]